MDTTKNTEKAKGVEKVKLDENKKTRFSLLVLIASVLSLGSLAWSTWSFIDLYQVDVAQIERLGGISLVSLSAAATMDLVWSGTMIAQYQGQTFRKKIPFIKKELVYDFLPLIGWAEALFVAGVLGYHGSTIGGGAAAFAAVLPVFTKLTWTLALNGLKDPTDLTDEEKAEIAAGVRQSRLTEAKTATTIKQHEADRVEEERKHAAALEEQKRANEIEREKTLAKIEKQRLEQQADFDLEKAKLEGDAETKLMRQQLNARLQIETLRSQQGITLERLDAEQEMRLRQPMDLGFNVIRGSVSRPQLTKGSQFGEDDIDIINGMALDGLDDMNLSEADRRKITLAARYFAADATEGGITKAAFAKANRTSPPRVTEATTAFPVEWFVERGLATWQD